MLILNGASSSGKTTLSKKLSNFGFFHLSSDVFFDSLLLKAVKDVVPSIFAKNLISIDDIFASVYYCTQLNKNYTPEQLNQLLLIKENKLLITEVLAKNGNLFQKILE